MLSQPSSSYPRHLLILLLLAFATHGLVLLNDGLYEDDWLVYTKLVQGNSDAIRTEWIGETGLPEAAYFHLLMGRLPWILLGYKFVTFTAVLTIATAAYLIARRTEMVTPQEALLIGVFTLIYPGNQTTVQPITTPYFLFYTVFMVAAYFAVRFEDAKPAYPKRLLPLALFVFAFALNSLLVFFYGFLVLLALYRRKLKALPLRESITAFAVTHPEYLLLGPVYWLVKKSLFPTGRYNEFRVSMISAAQSVYVFFRDGLVGQAAYCAQQLAQHWFLSLVVLIAVLALFRMFQARSTPPNAEKRSVAELLLYGVILLGSAIFPYVAVGKAPAVHGYSTRHGLLLSIPFAIFMTAGYRFLRNRQSYRFARVALLAMAISACVLADWSAYINWQVRAIKDNSIIANLERMQTGRDISIFWVDDRFPAGPTPGYKYYEWSSMFELAWGNESHIGLDTYYYDPGFLLDMRKEFHTVNNLSTFNPEGTEADLTIVRGDDGAMSDIDLVGTYMYNRFFDRPAFERFLTSFTTVEIKPRSH